MNQQTPDELVAILKKIPAAMGVARNELGKRIYGQEALITQMLAALLGRGHCLLTGVPGLAKTLLISSIGEIADLQFKRLQFTPDMMPSDITGSEILEVDQATGVRNFKFIKGPVFTQLLLADEINRTPPKTQAALLEAMQEHVVTAAGKRYPLDQPFFVLATQNPIEQEGTYPLPEAQLDRFMFGLTVDYPSFEDEIRILQNTTNDQEPVLQKVVSARDILDFQNAVRCIPVPQSVAEFTARLVRATRPGQDGSPALTNQYIRWGAGPRACQCLIVAGKVFAALEGRFNVSTGDILQAVHPVLRHRIILNYRAEADQVTVEQVVDELVKATGK